MKDKIITVIFVVVFITIIGAWSIKIMPIALGIFFGIELFSWIAAGVIGTISGIADVRKEIIEAKEEKQREERRKEIMRMFEENDE